MGQGEPAGPGRLVPAVRGGAHHGGGRPTTGAGGQRAGAGPQLPLPGTSEPALRPPGPLPVRPADLQTVNAAEALSSYLHTWSADFLRSLRLHEESVGSAETAAAAADAARRLRRASRRLSGTLHTYRPLVDGAWADKLCVELRWLSDTLSKEYGHAARLDRLHSGLQRLASEGGGGEAERSPGGSPKGGSGGSRSRGGDQGAGADTGPTLPPGTARAGALLERQLTLARTRAHSAALQALVSNRFHAVADAVAVLASEVQLAPQTAQSVADAALVPLADQARQRLVQAVGALPFPPLETPYHADFLSRPVTARTSRLRQDAAWHEVRLLLRLHRYAEEVLLRGASDDGEDGAGGEGGARARLASASAALGEHRDAVEAAEAAAAAARTPRIAPVTAYALGVLHADQRQAADAACVSFGRLWHRTVSQVL